MSKQIVVEKQKALEKISQEIEQCEICKMEKTGKAVPGEGNPDADIVFLGEAPGKTEAATGRPFIGRSGKLLRRLINEAGLEENNVYITSPVKYLPLRGTPTSSHIAHGKIHLDGQIKVINPKVIVLLGRVAAAAVLPEVISVSKQHGEIIKKGDRTYFITVHPAAALRFTRMRDILLGDFKKLAKLVPSARA